MSPPQVPGEPVSTAIWSGTVLASGETVPYYESLHCWVCFHAYIPAAALSHNDQNAEKTPRGKDGTMEFWITSCSHLICGPCARSLAEKAQTGSPPCPACHARDTSYRIFSGDKLNTASIGMTMWLPSALEQVTQAFAFQHSNVLHLLTYYRRHAQMQQRVFEGMAGELREARRNAKELARCKEENMTLRRKFVGQEEVTTSRFPSAARRAHAVNVGTKIDHSEGHSHPSVRAGTLPPTDATHDSNPLVRFYRTEPVIQETTPANKTICQVLPEDGETSSAIQKRSGSGLPRVRSRLSIFRAPSSPSGQHFPSVQLSSATRPRPRALTTAPPDREERSPLSGSARRVHRAISLAPRHRSENSLHPAPTISELERRRSTQHNTTTAPTLYGRLPVRTRKSDSVFRPPDLGPSTSRKASGTTPRGLDGSRSGFRPASHLPFSRPYRPY